MNSLSAFDLTGRVALITGGGTGIGRAIALMLAERGADVVVAGRRIDPLEKTAVEVRELSGKRCLAISANVRDPADCRALSENVAAELGRIDILVNNAGGNHKHIGLAQMDVAGWDRDIQLNLSATQYCSQAAFLHLRAARGCIVNISSLAGLNGTQGVGAYSAAKAGLQMLTRVQAAEWGPMGIRANCVAPGMTATEKAHTGWEKSGFDATSAAQVFPLRRYGECHEVAQAVAFFASDAASYITGETLAVGGGPQIGGMIKLEG